MKTIRPFYMYHITPEAIRNEEFVQSYFPFCVIDYMDTLPPSSDCLVAMLDSSDEYISEDYLAMTDNPNEIFSNTFKNIENYEDGMEKKEIKAYFYRLCYRDCEAEKIIKEKGGIDLDQLLIDRKYTVQKLREYGFINMNHIFEYENSIIFMKCDPEELTRFIISRFLYSFRIKGYTDYLDGDNSFRIEALNPFKNYYYHAGIKIDMEHNDGTIVSYTIPIGAKNDNEKG